MSLWKSVVIAGGACLTLAAVAQGADLPTMKGSPPKPAAATGFCTTFQDFLTTSCPLTYAGVTLYGTVDMGVGYEKFGAPWNPTLNFADDYLISKPGRPNIFELSPNALSQSVVGVKIKEDFGSSGWSFVGQAETGFDPFSFQLANGPGAIYENNLVNLPYQSSSGDSARAGQPFNSQLFAGVSNSTFGTLTWGRENTLLLDGVNGYDPMGGSYAFSVIGFSGTTAGGGNTEDTRSNTAFKYRGTYNNFRVGALVQTGGYEQDNGADQIYQGQFGFDLYNFSFDAIGSYAVDSDHLGTLDGSTSFTPTKYPAGTLDAVSATISNDTSIMLLGKYVWNQLTWYGGFEDIKYANPTSNWAIGTSSSPSVNNFFTGIGGYLAVNKGDAFYTPEYFQVYWTGLKYAFTPDLVGSVAYYHYNQEFYQSSAKSIASCNSSAHGNCAGTLDAVSALIDYRFGFAQKFDVYAGAMFSQVNDGLAAGYQTGGHVNIDPTVGLRFRF